MRHLGHVWGWKVCVSESSNFYTEQQVWAQEEKEKEMERKEEKMEKEEEEEEKKGE